MSSTSVAERLDELTYLRPNINDNTLEDQTLNNCSLDNGRHNATSKYDLGELDLLPLELLNEVLVHIDLRSLTDFRRVSRRAMDVVDAIPQYKIIVSHAPSALRGILTIETGRWITCAQLYRTLSTANCEQCNDFGGYLYLATCERVCFLCLSEDDRFCPLLRCEAIRKFGLNPIVVSTIPSFRSIPGSYAPNEIKCRKRLTLIDFQSAQVAGIALHGSVAKIEQHVLRNNTQKLDEYAIRLKRWLEGGTETAPRRPRSENAFDGRSSNPRRYMAIVPAPWFDPQTRSLSRGFHCVGCKDECESDDGMNRTSLNWRRKFTVQSFVGHVEQCGDIDVENCCHY